MSFESMGFIGGGRVVRILLTGFRRAGLPTHGCVVADTSPEALESLREEFPGIRTTGADLDAPSQQDVVFGALHPPALEEVMPSVGPRLQRQAVFVSLAPKIRVHEVRAALGGFDRVMRMVPSAPSLVGEGYNPVAFSEALDAADRLKLTELLTVLGEIPEVAEEDLEAYAVLTAMGPTYFWFQFDELVSLGRAFGLSTEATRRALQHTVRGSAAAFFSSGHGAEDLMDLIPAKPLNASEDAIRAAYRHALTEVHEKLTRC